MALRILYLEDHFEFAQQVSSAFLSEHHVTIVPSLAAARKAIAESEFDLLLADYDLEDGKGNSFVREFRTRYSKTPIIAVSSHDEGNAALRAAGANAICAKLEFDTIGKVLQKLGLI